MKSNFTFLYYTHLLKYFGETRKYITFSEYQNTAESDPVIILRHDIDFSLKYSLKMATLEADLGIKSTYFLLFSSLFYNLLDKDNIQIISQIKNLGHEIGLHYDLSVLESGNKEDSLSLLNAQADILSNVTGFPVASIAMHNPGISGEDVFRNTKYINVYDDKFVKGMGYFSDSCMAWRNNFIEHLKLDDFPSKIQLLIHPILWSDEEVTRWDKMDEVLLTKIKEIENEGEMIKGLWKTHPGVVEHEKRISNQE